MEKTSTKNSEDLNTREKDSCVFLCPHFNNDLRLPVVESEVPIWYLHG